MDQLNEEYSVVIIYFMLFLFFLDLFSKRRWSLVSDLQDTQLF